MADDHEASSLLSVSIDDNNNIGPQSPICCGSTTAHANVNKTKTGKFERKSSGGSFKVTFHQSQNKD